MAICISYWCSIFVITLWMVKCGCVVILGTFMWSTSQPNFTELFKVKWFFFLWGWGQASKRSVVDLIGGLLIWARTPAFNLMMCLWARYWTPDSPNMACVTPLSNHQSKTWTLESSKEWPFSLRCRWTAESCPNEVAYKGQSTPLRVEWHTQHYRAYA